jgi:hypothetical protein
MGIEFYKNRPMIYGIPTFFLQTEAVRNLPSSVMSRYKLPPDSTAADFIEARGRGRARAMAETNRDRWIEKTPASAVHLLVFDQNAALKEIRVQPLEQYGGGVSTVDERVNVPRFRRGLPLMPTADSPVIKNVLDRLTDECRRYGTEVRAENGVAVIAAR